MPFPRVIDNTMRSAWRKCPQSFNRSFIENLAPTVESTHLIGGGAFAAGLAAARVAHAKGYPLAYAYAQGVEALIKAYGRHVPAPDTSSQKKSLARILDAYWEYFHVYPIDTDFLQTAIIGGQPAVEFTFCLPSEVPHPDSGDPVLIGGRFDRIATFNDNLLISDEKTTVALGAQWSDQWSLDSQFTTYIWGARQHKIPVTGAVVRGVGIYVDRVEIVSVPISRTPHDIERWWRQLNRDIFAMTRAYQEGYFDYALDKLHCAAYGGCAFRQLCLTEPNEANWLGDYRHRLWEPTKSNPEIPLP